MFLSYPDLHASYVIGMPSRLRSACIPRFSAVPAVGLHHMPNLVDAGLDFHSSVQILSSVCVSTVHFRNTTV